MLKGIYIMDQAHFEDVYNSSTQAEISKLVKIISKPISSDCIKDNLEILKEVDIIFSGWGAPIMDTRFLNNCQSLKAVFYAAGSVKGFTTKDFWKRDIKLTSAFSANSIPVAEFTFAQIILSLKKCWKLTYRIKEENNYLVREDVPGCYKTTVGLISLGAIARNLIKLLKNLDIEIIAYDPYVSEEECKKLGVTKVPLIDIFKLSDVVSLHSPWLKETENLITREHFNSMKKDSTFINTSRGAIVNEEELINVFSEREDITALLDVTWPEPPVKDSKLYKLKNIFLTPHIAGSLNKECGRMGEYMLQELRLFLENKPLNWEITEKKAQLMA